MVNGISSLYCFGSMFMFHLFLLYRLGEWAVLLLATTRRIRTIAAPTQRWWYSIVTHPTWNDSEHSSSWRHYIFGFFFLNWKKTFSFCVKIANFREVYTKSAFLHWQAALILLKCNAWGHRYIYILVQWFVVLRPSCRGAHCLRPSKSTGTCIECVIGFFFRVVSKESTMAGRTMFDSSVTTLFGLH